MAADEKMKGGKCQKHKWQLKPVQVEFSSQGFPSFFLCYAKICTQGGQTVGK